MAGRLIAEAFHLNPEKVAYWYFRLNGFFQIENFVVHPGGSGSQRTDADILAVRFPARAELLLDHPNSPMPDDVAALSLSSDLIDVVITEVKTNQPCTLNGPWTREDAQNVHRVLAAIGCIPHDRIKAAAAAIYKAGIYEDQPRLRVRLVAVGRERGNLGEGRARVTQLTWVGMLTFIWHRFDTYRRQKTQVDQWDDQGKALKRLVDKSESLEDFLKQACGLLGVDRGAIH